MDRLAEIKKARLPMDVSWDMFLKNLVDWLRFIESVQCRRYKIGRSVIYVYRYYLSVDDWDMWTSDHHPNTYFIYRKEFDWVRK